MCAGQAWLETGTAAPLIRARGGYGQALHGSFENSQELPAVASGWRGMEMMPSLRSVKEMPGLKSLALPECNVGGNVYGGANVNGSATATGWQYVTTGAGAMYAMPRPSAAVPVRGRWQKSYEMTLAAYSSTWAGPKMRKNGTRGVLV